jgi:hypothetical protein
MKPQKETTPNRELDDLRRRAATILELSDEGLRDQFIEIARDESPTQSYERAFDLACDHFDPRVSREFAKAARFLAMIRRDYGDEQFEEVVS